MKRLLLLSLALTNAFAATPREPRFIDANYATGLSLPTCIAWAPDQSGRLFVSLKAKGIGIVRSGVLQTPLFASFSPLYAGSECGVLGLAFDPNYATNRYVYVFVTVSASEQQIIRFTDQDGVGIDRTVIIAGLPTRGRNHNGGALAFGADGKLYWAIGDNGIKRGVDGDLTTLAGKVGRANPDGSVPDDNPFNDGPGPRNDYIWATGFRNPFTMTFRPGTNELWLNVVGSTLTGQTSPRTTAGYEQIFKIEGGDDGGYDDYEGNQPGTPRYTTPFPRPCIKPRIQYPTGYAGNGTLLRSIASAAPDNSGRLLVTVSKAHGFRVGQMVTVSGAGPYNGSNVVLDVPSSTQVTLNLPPGETQSISTGRVDVAPQGLCVVGGCFYDGTSFPAKYAGNFFYGDLSGRIMRAELTANGFPTAIGVFATGAGGVTDLAVGPDGALYYCSVATNSVRRISYAERPAILVAPSQAALTEGGQVNLSVRLAAPPESAIPVAIRRLQASGPGRNLAVLGNGVLYFTPENWSKTQTVTVFAPPDVDTTSEAANFTASASGYETASVTITAKDVNLPAVIVSTANVDVVEGDSTTFELRLASPPSTNVTATVRYAAGATGKVRVSEGASVQFTPANWNTPVTVRLTGLQDADKDPAIVDLRCAAVGYRAAMVRVSVIDDDPRKPVFTTVPPQSTVVGQPFLYVPQLRALPAPTFSLTGPAGALVNDQSGQITWTPEERGDFPFTLRAVNSTGVTDQVFNLTVVRDQPPKVAILGPQSGAVLTGQVDLWALAIDDYGVTKAEFYVDTQLVGSESSRKSLYEFGGSAYQFDSSSLPNGAHTLKVVVYDDRGQTGESSVPVTVSNP